MRNGLQTDGLARLLLISLAMALLVGVAAGYPAALRVSVTAAVDADQPSRSELFYSLFDQGYHPQRGIVWQPLSAEAGERSWVYRGLWRVHRIRIDPMASGGEVRLERIRIEGAGGQRTLTGAALLAAIEPGADLQLQSLSDQAVVLTARGDDPSLEVRIPAALQRPALGQRLLLAALAGLLAGLLWWQVERRFARRPTGPARPPREAVGLTLAVGCCLLISWLGVQQISDRPIQGDAVQNLTFAYNLKTFGVFSHHVSEQPEPSNYREPLPPVLLAGHLQLLDWLGHPLSLDQLRNSDARLAKQVNGLWIFLASLGLWLLAAELLGSHALAALCVFPISGLSVAHPAVTDHLYTELPAMALMSLAGLALVRAWKRNHRIAWLLSGLLIGGLALTKSAFFVIAPVALLTVGLLLWTRHRSRPLWLPLLLLSGGFVLSISPWILRNHIQLDTAQVSGRSGVLYGRAVLNGMTGEEIRGWLHLNGPHVYHKLVEGSDWGLQPGDLDRGGRWQRIYRGPSDYSLDDRTAALDGRVDDAISFHYRVVAEHVALSRELQAAGHPRPEVEADAQLRQKGLTLISNDPLRHLLMSGVFAWGGFWSIPQVELPFVPVHLQRPLLDLVNLSMAVALLAGLLLGLRRPDWLLPLLLPALMLAFYALLTHNIARYSLPAQPLLLLAVAVSPWLLLRTVRQRRRYHSR